MWEGRHKSSLVQSDRYFLTCCRYIELNPVVADMVSKLEEYKCSSYLVNAWGMLSALTFHEEYLRLGVNSEERCHAYRELFMHHISEHDVHLIEKAGEYCHPIGDDRFKLEIENKYGVVIGQSFRGRPKKELVD